MFRGFTQKKVNSYTLGEQLKKIRAQGRITLHEVSRETKIPVKYLEMIEEGKYESLPPDVYVKGFLKSYADFLGVDAKKIVKLYQRERDIKNNLNGQEQKKPVVQKKTKVANFIVTPRLVFAAFITIAIVGGFFYLYRQIGRFAAEPRLVITEPSASDGNIDGNSITVSGFTDSDAKLSINDQPVMVNDNGAFNENILLQGGMNTITISSVNRFNKSVSKTLNINSGYQVAQNSQDETEGKISGEEDAKREGVSLIVRIDSAATWLSVESDGNLVYSGTMLPGAIQNFEGEKEVRITSGKANQTFIRVNGKDERTLDSSPGIVRDVVFGPND